MRGLGRIADPPTGDLLQRAVRQHDRAVAGENVLDPAELTELIEEMMPRRHRDAVRQLDPLIGHVAEQPHDTARLQRPAPHVLRGIESEDKIAGKNGLDRLVRSISEPDLRSRGEAVSKYYMIIIVTRRPSLCFSIHRIDNKIMVISVLQPR